MAIDSAAGLLFSISANTDEATENIARFRALMGQNLDDLLQQFSDWSDEVLGDISTVSGAMIAATAGLAAGALAIGAAVKESTADYHEYAEQIYKASVVTGMHAEDLSALHSMAAKTGVDFGTLTQGLARFASNVFLASQGSKLQMTAFAALGISQKDVILGQKDMLPLLEKVMDGFHNNASAVQKAAIARDLFSRGGEDLIDMLSKGSGYMKATIEECERYGLTLTTKDVDAAHAFTVSQTMMKEQLEGIAATIGKTVMPYLENLSAGMIAAASSWREIIKGFAEGGALGGSVAFGVAYTKAIGEIEEEVKKARTEGAFNLIGPDSTKKIKEAAEDFNGISSIVDSMRGKIASFGTEWDKLSNEMAHTHEETDRAEADLQKLEKAGKITPEVFRREMSALALIPGMIQKIVAETSEKINATETQKWGEAVEKSAEAQDEITFNLQKAAADRLDVTKQIAAKMAETEDQSYAGQRARLEQEMQDWAANLLKKTQLRADDWNAIDKITMQGLAKIAQTQAFQEDLRKLQEHTAQLLSIHTTEQQKLTEQYQKDLQEYSAVEEAKALKTAQSEAQIIQIQQMYAQIRQQITQKYQQDLQQLQNSQGWQGVFGNFFAQQIRQNQSLSQQWATSTNQSLLMVQVAMESLRETGAKAFQDLATGMGSAITNALIMSKSVGQAMEQMLESTLQSIAGQAAGQAIYSLALGFLDEAEMNYAGAAMAFTAAEIFGSVAAVATAGSIGMKALGGGGSAASLAGSGGSASKSGSQYGKQGSSAVAGSGGTSPGAQGSGPNVYVTVQGHVIGASGTSQLCDLISQAVRNNGATLMSTHNQFGVPLT